MKLNSAIFALPLAVQVLAFPINTVKRGSISNVEESLESNNNLSTRSTDPSGGDVTAAIQARTDKHTDNTKKTTNTLAKASKKSSNKKVGNQKRTNKKANPKDSQKSSNKKAGNQKRASTQNKVKTENEEKAEVLAAALGKKGSKATKRAETAHSPNPKAPKQ